MGRAVGPGPGVPEGGGRGGLGFWVLGGRGGWGPGLLNPRRRGLGAWIPGSRGGEGGERLLDSRGGERWGRGSWMRRLEDTGARCPPEPSGEVEGERLALAVPLAAEGLTSGWRGGGGAGKGLRGFEGSRVSRARWGRRRGGGCLGCQTGQGQRRGQGMSGGGEAQHPGSLGDLGFQAPAPSSLRPGSPQPSPLPQNSRIRTLSPLYPRTRARLGLGPLFPSDLGVHSPAPTLHKTAESGPLAPSSPEPRRPHLLSKPQLDPSPLGVKGAGPAGCHGARLFGSAL